MIEILFKPNASICSISLAQYSPLNSVTVSPSISSGIVIPLLKTVKPVPGSVPLKTQGYQRQLQQNIAAVIHASATASTDAIDEKLLALQQELLKKAHNKEAYDEIADEIFRLRELKQQTTVDTVTRDEQIKRITALQDFIRSQPAELTEFDEALVKRWLRKITVWTDKYTVELKSGLNVDIDAES